MRSPVLHPRILGFGSLLLLLGLAEVTIRTGLLSEYVVPPPSAIILSLSRVVSEEDVLARFLLTGGEALGTFALITVTGIPFGILLARSALLRQAVETWVAALAAAPVVLAYPLFLVIFGRNALTIMMIGFVAGLAPVVLKTVEGMSGARRVLLDVGRGFRLTPSQMFWKIQLPAALPSIFTGLRLGLIFSLINIVGVEFLINFGGLGQLINELAERYDLPGTYGAILFVIAISMACLAGVERLERWARPAP